MVLPADWLEVAGPVLEIGRVFEDTALELKWRSVMREDEAGPVLDITDFDIVLEASWDGVLTNFGV